MARSTSSRRISLDIFQRAVSDISSEVGAYMDLRLPPHSSSSNDVSKVECECCGLFEECTGAYVRRVRDRFCGRWVCGLCSEAVKEELVRRGLARQHAAREEALSAHMEVCRRFHRTVRANPAMSVAIAMTEILKKGSQRGGGAKGGMCKMGRSYSAV
ncbi:hypothetical protein Taro_055019 [Colocasia esculenta]|uniref:DUF1677 family protein n=1 Tax=Colocasia esculenta TaxID=4460 RepID=A0A843XS71_COLES|nr:hypothetical protein [Colocasia esculenta]